MKLLKAILGAGLLFTLGCFKAEDESVKAEDEAVFYLEEQDIGAIHFSDYLVIVSQSPEPPSITVLEKGEIIHGIELEKGKSKVRTHRYDDNIVKIYFDSNGDGILDQERVIEREPTN